MLQEKVLIKYLERQPDYYDVLLKVVRWIPDIEFYEPEIHTGVCLDYQKDIDEAVTLVRRYNSPYDKMVLAKLIERYEKELKRIIDVKRKLFVFELLQQSQELQLAAIKHLVDKYHLEKRLKRYFLK
ncbi:hypothetical protein AB3331_09415 [Streptococcus sp. H49]|uniref:hypothetical protein n=1 Tax=Streptococcus huangxiaojuni TaxID=3237239 RepID=UPI0034A1EB40